MAPLRLRVPAALAVAVLGVSAPIALSFGGCQEETSPEPTDAGNVGKVLDAPGSDAPDADTSADASIESADASTQMPVDAGVAVDASEDPVVDAFVPPPPDAADPPPH